MHPMENLELAHAFVPHTGCGVFILPSAAMEGVNLLDWYYNIPPVTRAMFTVSFAITAGCALDFLSPFSLYYNYSLIWNKGEVRGATHKPAHLPSAWWKRT